MAPLPIRLYFILAAGALLRAQTAPLSDDVLLLGRIRRHALGSLATIPSYTCLETIDRETRVSARQPFKPLDVVQLEVAEFGARELFAWPGQTNFEDKDGQILGLSSHGEFYAHLHTVMAGSSVIRYAGKENCEGSPCVRYDFQVAQPFTGWTLTSAGGRSMVAESGSFWADLETANVFRLVVTAEDIPVELGMRSAELDIHYGSTNLINGRPSPKGSFFSESQPFQLPQSFSLHTALYSGQESLNTVSFTHCREYQAESKVVAEAAPEIGPEPQLQELTLPARLNIELRLTTPVRSGVNHVGDRIEAVVDREVRNKGGLLLPRGAEVVGRVRRMEHYTTPYEYWIAALEFTDVVFTREEVTEHVRFTGSLQFYDTLPGLKQEIATERSEGMDLGNFGGIQKIHREKLIARQLPELAPSYFRGLLLRSPRAFICCGLRRRSRSNRRP